MSDDKELVREDLEGKRKRHEQLESICRRCGRCCRQKFRVGDDILITDIPCEFLDLETHTCTVYPQRFFKQPLCSSIEIAVAGNAQPDDCPYVGGNSNYRTPLLLDDHPEYREAVEEHFAKPKVTLSPKAPKKQGK